MGCSKSKEVHSGPQVPKAEVIFVIGGPGSGISTQCQLMVEKYCFIHIQLTDFINEERQKGGPDGQMIENLMNEGKLVPSELLVKLIKKEIISNGNTGRYLLDGFPRSLENVKSWDSLIGDSVTIKFLLFFDCSLEVMEKRLLKRGETSGRADDNAETIKKRFDTFKNETAPIIAEYEKKKLVRKISSEPAPQLVNLNVIKELSLAGIMPQSKAEVIFVLGGPGSGVEIQCQKLVKDFKYVHLSAYQIYEAEVHKANQKLEQKEAGEGETQNVLQNFKKVFNQITKEILKRQLKGTYLIDGFPKFQANIEEWNKVMSHIANVKLVFYLDQSFEVMKNRQHEKQELSGQTQKRAELSLQRFNTQQAKFQSLLDDYTKQGLVRIINADPAQDQVYLNITKELGHIERHPNNDQFIDIQYLQFSFLEKIFNLCLLIQYLKAE